MSTILIADDEPQLAQDLVRRVARCWVGSEIVAVVDNGVAAAAWMQCCLPAPPAPGVPLAPRVPGQTATFEFQRRAYAALGTRI